MTQIIKNESDERSIGDLFSELANETSTLIRQEVALAQAEMTQKAVKAGKDVGFLAIGGTVIYVGFLAIIAAIIVALANFIPLWLSCLLVGVIIGIIGAIMVFTGLKDLKQLNPVPEQTVQTIKEDVEWMKEQV